MKLLCFCKFPTIISPVSWDCAKAGLVIYFTVDVSRSATAMVHPTSSRETPGVISAQCSDSPDGHLSQHCQRCFSHPRSDPRIAVGIDNVWILSVLGIHGLKTYGPCFSYVVYFRCFFFAWENGKTHEIGLYKIYIIYII